VNVQGTSQHKGRALTDPPVLYVSCVIKTAANLSMSFTYVPHWEGHGAVPPLFLLYLQPLCMPRGHIGGERGTAPLILNLSTPFSFRSREQPPVAAGFEADYSQHGRRR